MAQAQSSSSGPPALLQNPPSGELDTDQQLRSASASPWGRLRDTMADYQHLSVYFVAGGAAGAVSRTVVSPLERLKILMQVQQTRPGGEKYNGIGRSLVLMWQREGVEGMFRGNGINCLRIIPYSAVQFTMYESLKTLLQPTSGEPLSSGTKLFAGALAGIASVVSTYPLDLVRARLSIAQANLAGLQPNQSLGIWDMTLKVYREEGGLRGLYRGMIPTAAGVAPYVALNFVLYDRFKSIFVPSEDDVDDPFSTKIVVIKLACGAVAGGLSQAVTYPFDVIRRKMQVSGLAGLSKAGEDMAYKSGTDAILTILRKEGLKGLYRGIWPNLLKVSPSMAASFWTYETVKRWIE